MFVILTYDVEAKRGAAIIKICRKYLRHVQKSVFEGTITEAKLTSLKRELERKIERDYDKIQIYKIESLKYTSKEEIGVVQQVSNIL